MPKTKNFDQNNSILIGKRAKSAEASRLALSAEKMREKGEDEKSRELLERAQVIDPENADSAWWLGDYWHSEGKIPKALTYFRKYLRLCPGDPEALHMIAALGGRNKPVRASNGYVRDHFDSFAEHFDKSLVKDLKYQVPKLLYRMVQDVRTRKQAKIDMLDLGCGTGLVGRKFQPIIRKVWGVDLSTEMAKRSRALGIYETVSVSEITAYLKKTRRTFDLVTAADVLIYFGDLSAMFRGVRRVLRHEGLFAVSAEVLSRGTYRLTDSGRYAHSEEYLRRLGRNEGFSLTLHRNECLRFELGKPVSGHIMIFKCI